VRELGGLADALAGATPVADAALLHDYDSRWALQIQPTNAELAYEETIQRHYEALRSRSVGVDVVGPSSDLSSYRLVAAPNLYVVDDAIAAGLHRFVEAGGTLVLAPRAGAKDGCNVTPDVPLPAALAKLAGLEVVDLVSVADGASVHFTGVDGLDRGVYRGWYEQVEPTSAHALALYEDGEFPETPAVTANPVGAGRVLYLAGAADLETLAGIYAAVARGLGLATAALPEGVERVELQRNGETLVVLLNHGDREQAVTLDEPRQDLLANGGRRRRVRLAPFGVAVLVPLRAALEKV
jgi:beta-galactosidase